MSLRTVRPFQLLLATAFVVVNGSTCLGAAEADKAITVVARPHPKPGARLDDPSLQARYDTMWNKYTTDMLAASEELLADLKTQADKALTADNTPLGSYWQGIYESCTRWGFVSWNEKQSKVDWQRFGNAPFPVEFAKRLNRISNTCDSLWRTLDKSYESLIRQHRSQHRSATAEALAAERKSLAAWHGHTGEETPPPLSVSEQSVANKGAAPAPTAAKKKRPLKKL